MIWYDARLSEVHPMLEIKSDLQISRAMQKQRL